MAGPVNGVAYSFTVSLFDMANPGRLLENPTISAGDFQISQDNGTFTNLATMPTVTPAGSTSVLVSLSAAEMTVTHHLDVRARRTADNTWGDGLWTLVPEAVAQGALTTTERTALVAAVKAMVAETEGTYTLGEILSIVLSAVAGVTDDSGTTLKTPNGVATRISGTVVAGERTAITLTPSS